MVRSFRRFVSYNRYGYPAKVRNHLGLETTICYNAFNMVGSVTDANGIATEYTYSPAGLVTRIVRRDGADKYTYDYHVDGQLATATYGNTTEDFLWDGLALVKRGKRGFVNEPHVGGGNPVMSSDGTTYLSGRGVPVMAF